MASNYDLGTLGRSLANHYNWHYAALSCGQMNQQIIDKLVLLAYEIKLQNELGAVLVMDDEGKVKMKATAFLITHALDLVTLIEKSETGDIPDEK